MKNPYKTRDYRPGPCCICQKKLTAERYSRYCCSKECDDKGDENMKASIARAKVRLKKFYGRLWKHYEEDETPLGQPTMTGKD